MPRHRNLREEEDTTKQINTSTNPQNQPNTTLTKGYQHFMPQWPHPCPKHECDRDSIKFDLSRLHLYHLTFSLAISFSPPLREPRIPFHGRIFSFAILFSPATRETGVPFHRRNFSFGFDFSPCILETLRAVLSRRYLNGFGGSFDVS